MAKGDKKNVDGVSKPGTTPPDSSAKPIIISHKPMIKDSTVTSDSAEKTDAAAKPEKPLTSNSSKVIEPLNPEPRIY